MSNIVENATSSGPKPLVGLNDLKSFFGKPNRSETDNNVDIEQNANEEAVTSLDQGPGGESMQDCEQPLLDRINAVFLGNEYVDHPRDSFPYADAGTPESIESHRVNMEGAGEKQEHAVNFITQDPPKSLDHHPDDKWWPVTADADNAGGDIILESRFGEPTPAQPPPAGSTQVKIAVDVNAYQQRKNLAHGLMDLALLSANANQLRYVLESSTHPYYYPSLLLVSLSIVFQIGVGILLIWNSKYDNTVKSEIHKAITVNNVTVAGVFLVTIINVFLSSFSVTPTNGMVEAAMHHH